MEVLKYGAGVVSAVLTAFCGVVWENRARVTPRDECINRTSVDCLAEPARPTELDQ